MEKLWILKSNSMNNCLKVTVALFLTAFFFFSEGKGVLNYKFCWFSSSAWFFPCSSPTKIFITLSNPSSSGEIMIDHTTLDARVRIQTQIFVTGCLDHQSSSSARSLIRSAGDFPIYCNIQVSFLGDLWGVLTWCQSVCVFFSHILSGGFLCWSCLWGRLAVGSEISSCFSATFCLSAGAGWVIKWLQGLSKIILEM